MLHSFNYIADEHTSTLIIGSMPGIASLEAHQYYAHKQNFFWRFIFEAFNENFDNPSYAEKINFLILHRIGLWDAAQTCIREGSLDSHIKNVVPNDFKVLFDIHPNISRLLFNGQKAFQLFKHFNGELLYHKQFMILPSTSPANASIPFNKKKALWIEALNP